MENQNQQQTEQDYLETQVEIFLNLCDEVQQKLNPLKQIENGRN